MKGKEAEAVRVVAAEVLEATVWEKLRRDHGDGPVEEVRSALRRLAEGSRRFRIFSDGGSHGNPGPSGAGGIIESEDGTEVDRFSLFLGVTTNNRAEYKALIEGLRRAEELGGEEIEVRLDSELLVKQLQGVYRVKSPDILPLYAEARERTRRFRKCVLLHVPREENRAADELAQRAIAEGAAERSGRGGATL